MQPCRVVGHSSKAVVSVLSLKIIIFLCKIKLISVLLCIIFLYICITVNF